MHYLLVEQYNEFLILHAQVGPYCEFVLLVDEVDRNGAALFSLWVVGGLVQALELVVEGFVDALSVPGYVFMQTRHSSIYGNSM